MDGSRLRKLREERELSQEELAKRLGIARTTYSGYENNAREPDQKTMDKIATFFDCSVDYLLGRTDTKESKIITNDQAKNVVLEEYARLPQEEKKLVDDLIRTLYKKKT